jgi:hypothetical protein
LSEKARELAATWSENWYGFWAEEADLLGREFDPDDHIDQAQPEDKDRLVGYLSSAPVVVEMPTSPVNCELCDEALSASIYRSDGDWLWPEALAHWVLIHDFVLPDRLIAHIRGRGYRAPEEIDPDIYSLPWPKR